MSTSSDRRATGVNRIPLATVVEICGRDAQVPAFEADAVELSGRGMQVRTEYLPELNAPLVLRFEDRGREVVVEGEVAWRREGDQSGEFGVRFTALDSKSVEVLRDLCGTQLKKEAEAEASNAAAQSTGQPGSPVKLHIEGLNAPMKARVRDSSGRRVQVGSSLEFLKVGRSIEVEDVEQGERKDARIDSVTVAIDPQTQVPQLVVALRYAGEMTPEPSVVDSEAVDPNLEAMDAGAEGAGWDDLEEGSVAPPNAYEEEDYDEDLEGQVLSGQLKDRFSQAASRIGALTRRGAASMGAMGAQAGAGIGKLTQGLTQGLTQRISTLRAERPTQPSRRRTAAAPAPVHSEGRKVKLQPQHRAAAARRAAVASASTGRGSKFKLAIGAVVLIVGTVGTTLALTSKGKEHAAEPQPQLEQLVVAAPAAQLPQELAAPAASGAQGEPADPGVVADVPLFGPTTLATAQPEPLAVAPADVAYEDQAPDQEFDDQPQAESEAASNESASSEPSPEDVQPYSQGRLHLPIVHRLRLDKPGTALKGFAKSNGFSVLIPGRKVLDNPKSIQKRDDRIAAVKADVTPDGAVVNFRFRGTVPSYKVRLKGDTVEFFISQPEQ